MAGTDGDARQAVIADLHCHYPMHLLAEDDRAPTATLDRMLARRPRPRWVDRLRVLVLRAAARHANFRDHASSWRVTLDGLERGGVRLVCSVLYEPFAEIDLDEPYGSDPEDHYIEDLLRHLRRTEDELARLDPEGRRHVVVRAAADLDAATADGRVAFVHCVEGGFHLGRTPAAVADGVARLAARGVGYITLAHLFPRQIAANAPALPMLGDRAYDLLFPQPRRPAITPLGEAAIRAMYEHRVLLDLSHLRPDALHAALDLLDALDAEHTADPAATPVVSSHAGFRLGRQAYLHDAAAVRRIAARDGVIGLILARHQLQDGLADGEGLDHTVRTLRAHADAIRAVAGSHAHVGIGSDLDGFIKPTMSGIEAAEDLAALEAPLRDAYGADADAILHGNAHRVLRRVLAARP